MMKRWEIGSEFEAEYGSERASGFTIPEGFHPNWTLSGRTAIDLAVRDAPGIRKICVPSYCCSSMIEPFLNNSIEVGFYSVTFDNGLDIDLSNINKYDAILLFSYFGYSSTIDIEAIKVFKERGDVVIQDVTHSLFSLEEKEELSDYLVASVRKWGSLISGGFVAKKDQEIAANLIPPDPLFVHNKQQAMQLKADYLLGKKVDKAVFLQLYHETNDWIAENYQDCSIDKLSKERVSTWNVNWISARRRENASCLHRLLRDSEIVQPIFKEEQMECPLFFPIVVRNGKRAWLQKRLRENDIYCPIHWPKPSAGCESNLYDTELSLICDQRYDKQDMIKISTIINS